MKKATVALFILIFSSLCGDLQAQDGPARKKGVYFTIGGGLASSYNEFSSNKDTRTVGPAVNVSVSVATRNNHTFGVEFDGYIGYNLNIIVPITIYQDNKNYFKFGPSVCRVGYDFADQRDGFGLALGVGADLNTAFIKEAVFSSIVINANFIIQYVGKRSTNYLSFTLSIRFSSIPS